MVIGENEKFASAIISPNFPFLHEWASRHEVKYRDNEELISFKEVQDRFREEVNELNKQLGEHEKIKRIRLVKEEWGPDSGELSPTHKLNVQTPRGTRPNTNAASNLGNRSWQPRHPDTRS